MTADPVPDAAAEAPAARPAKDRIRLATLALHVSAVFYVLIGLLLALVPLGWDPAVEPEYALRAGITWFLSALCVALAVLAWVLIRALRRRRRWAWVTSVGLFVLFLPSVFLPLGALGLFGLLGAETRAQFPSARPERVRRRA